MLLFALAVAQLLVWLFGGDLDIEPIVWAGAFVGQGAYSGGRLVANAIASDSKINAALRKRAYDRRLMSFGADG